MSHTTLLIVDDHTVVRKGIRMIVSTRPGFEVIGEAVDGQDAFEQVKTLQPDIVLMDLLMPVGGFEAITKIKKSFPVIKILVLTTYIDKQKISEALNAGADGYLLKEVDGQALLDAIDQVRRGGMPLHPQAATYLFKGEVAQNGSRTGEPISLTDRERDVLELVCQGLSNKEIGIVLNLSLGTIKIHVSHILAKLNATSRTEAAVKATQLNLVPIAVMH